MKTFPLFFLCFFSVTAIIAQQPAYTPKHFVCAENPKEFKSSGPVKNGLAKSYIVAALMFHDVDDKNTTHIRANGTYLLYIEGEIKNGKKQGITKQFLIDSADHSKRFLISEQTYANDKLNGVWNFYNLKGTLVQTDTYTNDSLNGISRQYWIDGKTIMDEREYINGRNKFISRKYFDNGKIDQEVTIVNGEPDGEVREYYESGILKDKFTIRNGDRDGLRIYYYPDGKPWIENTYKNGKPWNVIANYDSKGNKRNAGTLKDGNGTMVYYDDDTTVREVITYVNGVEQR